MKEVDKDISNKLSDWLKSFKRGFATDYPGLPDNWLTDEETAIEWIIEKDAERCREIIQLSVNTIDAIEDLLSSTKDAFNRDIKNNNLDPWPTGHLFFLVTEFHNTKDKSDLVERARSQSLTMTILGLTTLWALANKRYFRHLEDKGTYNQLLVWSTNLPAEYQIALPEYIEAAMQKLSSSAMYKYNGMVAFPILQGKEERIMRSFVYEYLKNITKDVDRILNMAERGHKDLRGTARAAARDYFDEGKKFFREQPVGDNDWNFENPFAGANSEAFAVLEELEAFESFVNSIENPEDREIVCLDAQGFTLTEMVDYFIEEKRPIPRNTIARRLKKRLSTTK